MQLSIPYYSQYQDVNDASWQPRACGITCIAMACAYICSDDETFSDIDALIKEGNELDGYKEGIGWVHDALVELARKHECGAYREEFWKKNEDESNPAERGISKITAHLATRHPVVVSVTSEFSSTESSHLIVLTGFETHEGSDELRGFYYNDPNSKDDSGEGQFVDIETFKKHWRELAIFVGENE